MDTISCMNENHTLSEVGNLQVPVERCCEKSHGILPQLTYDGKREDNQCISLYVHPQVY
jgi:hypothetical protein